MRWWKLVGLAGVVGVAAVGITVGRSTVERRRREFADAEPDELRERLRARYAEAVARRETQIDGAA